MRVAVIGVSHWHTPYDVAYLGRLARVPDVHLVGLYDPISRSRRIMQQQSAMHLSTLMHSNPDKAHATRRTRFASFPL